MSSVVVQKSLHKAQPLADDLCSPSELLFSLMWCGGIHVTGLLVCIPLSGVFLLLLTLRGFLSQVPGWSECLL